MTMNNRIGMRKISIAIDGPAGAGKTTVARELAKRLGLKYVDTGAMYRAVAWKMIQEGIPLHDEDAIVRMASNMNIDFADGDGSRILVDGMDVSKEIRSPEVTRLSSPVSAIPGVRRILVAKQRSLAADDGVVMEGRDIGTVVLPDAQVKVFLEASIDERARRRYTETIESGGNADYNEIRRSIAERDNRDSTREDSPLCKADDAITINTDSLSIEQVVNAIKELYNRAVG